MLPGDLSALDREVARELRRVAQRKAYAMTRVELRLPPPGRRVGSCRRWHLLTARPLPQRAVVVFGVLGLAAVASATTRQAQAADVPPVDLDGWTPPSIGSVGDDPLKYGYTLFADTANQIGPAADDPAKRFSGSGLTCQNCHLKAATQLYAVPSTGVWGQFPQYRGREGEIGTLEERINGCMERSMNGHVLPLDGREMKAYLAYMKWLSTGIPDGANVGAGTKSIKEPGRAADLANGAKVFIDTCALCDGKDGIGQRTAEGNSYRYTPLVGPDSYNNGASIASAVGCGGLRRRRIHEQPRAPDQSEPRQGFSEASCRSPSTHPTRTISRRSSTNMARSIRSAPRCGSSRQCASRPHVEIEPGEPGLELSMDFGVTDLLAIFSSSLVGFILGAIGGGGSILAVPLLVYVVGVKSPHVAIGTSSIAVAVRAFANLIDHARRGHVCWPVAIPFAIAGVAGTALGSTLGKHTEGQRLLILFGMLMVEVATSTALRIEGGCKPQVLLEPRIAPRVGGLGFVVGALSGFFGIGGGFLVVPGLVAATSMALIVAIGSSLLSVTAFGLTTVANYAMSGLIDWWLVLLFVVGGIGGGLAGGRLATRPAPRKRALSLVFGVIFASVGMYVIVRGIVNLMSD
jgi:uncharacterized protein